MQLYFIKYHYKGRDTTVEIMADDPDHAVAALKNSIRVMHSTGLNPYHSPNIITLEVKDITNGNN